MAESDDRVTSAGEGSAFDGLMGSEMDVRRNPGGFSLL